MLRKLKQKKYRNDSGYFLCEGLRVFETAMQTKDIAVEMVVWQENMLDNPVSEPYIQNAKKSGIEQFYCTTQQMKQISDDASPPGIVFKVRQNLFSLHQLITQTPIAILYIDRIADPGNLGTIIRSAVWFGFPHIVLSPGSADVFNPKTVRSTAGAVFTVCLSNDITFGELFEFSRAANYQVIASEPGAGIPLGDWVPAARSVMCIGPEATGLDDSILNKADLWVRIPGADVLESLNVAVAAGIILHHQFEYKNKDLNL